MNLPINREQRVQPHVAVVIPCFKVKAHIGALLEKIATSTHQAIHSVYLIDDACPDQSGEYINNLLYSNKLISTFAQTHTIKIISHTKNQGVGGAVLSGYAAAIDDGAEIIVKLDGDGQMDPDDIESLIDPIQMGWADYTKGNRFFDLTSLRAMPPIRLLGNAVLSFINKASSGYWSNMDPTNGFTAIHRECLKRLDFAKIDRRYFFESDMLFRLGTLRAVVVDVPLPARYSDEISNLRIFRILFEFPPKYLKCILKRIFYLYLLRDFNAGSLFLFFGSLLFGFGLVFGAWRWWHGILTHTPTLTGTVMLAVVPVVIGFQLLLSFIQFDVANTPNRVQIKRTIKR